MADPDETILNANDSLCVEDILRKYGIGSNSSNTESHGSEGSESSTAKTITKPARLSPKVILQRTKLPVYELSDSDSDPDSVSKPPSPKISKKTPSPRKKSPRINVDAAEKALEKAQKKQDAENKKQEAAKNKEIKKMLSDAHKQLKPDECLKYVTAIVDEAITNNNDLDLGEAFKELGSNYKIHSQIIPNTVTWTRKVNTHVINDDGGTLKPSSTIEDLPDLLLILSAQELFDYIKADKLIEHLKTIESIYINKSVSLGVVGLNKQLKLLRGKGAKGSLSSLDVKSALTDVQIFCNCCYRNLDGPHDLAGLLCQFTKAIAQRPYKLQQQEKYASTNWYMKGDNKDCVKVDKKGNGLKRLWQQQITSFPLARLETAESIIEKYPTLSSLMEAYDFSVTKERETLLADIPVRRNAGPMTASRRIGNEMSKKISVFFNALDGDTTIS